MIDHLSGLAPLADEIDASNSTIFARMAVSHKAAKQDLSSKFGAPPQDMPALLSAIVEVLLRKDDRLYLNDVLPGRVGLPTDIRPGDHIEFSCIGAYSLTGRTTFNGHYSDRIVIIDD